jgi:hypothetical protein
VPCKVTVAGRRHAGIVLNVSPNGLYVQTNAVASSGTRVDIDLTLGPERTIPLQATVVWRRLVPRELRNDARGGFGLRIRSASESYYELLTDCLPAESCAARRGGSGLNSPTPGRSAQVVVRQRYRVRVGQSGGSRSRWLVIACDSESEARRRALTEVGDTWHVLEVEQE